MRHSLKIAAVAVACAMLGSCGLAPRPEGNEGLLGYVRFANALNEWDGKDVMFAELQGDFYVNGGELVLGESGFQLVEGHGGVDEEIRDLLNAPFTYLPGSRIRELIAYRPERRCASE